MNRDRVEGSWKTMKGKIRKKREKLTGDDPDVIAGKRDQLAGRPQQKYGRRPRRRPTLRRVTGRALTFPSASNSVVLEIPLIEGLQEAAVSV